MKKFAWAVGLVGIGFLAYNVFSSFLLDFDNINVESLRQRFSEIHFAGPGNDFGGSVFWLDAKNLSTGFILEHSTGATYERRSCMTQVRGIYYNNQRGLRLWPLDTASLTMLRATSPTTYDSLHMTGGFFRDCITLGASTGTDSPYSIYGYIQYTLSGDTTAITSSLAAGVKLNFAANAMMTGLANNFQYFNNTTPIGYIYDSNGGIGFVGGMLSGHNNLITFLNTGANSISDAFIVSGLTIIANPAHPGWEFINLSGLNSAQDTLWKLVIQGAFGVSKSISPEQRLSLLGNPEKRTVIYGGTEINSSTILNLARKNAQNLCRGKKVETCSPVLGGPASSTDPIRCFNNCSMIIDLNNKNYYTNKTLIINSGNVILSGTMGGSDGPAEIFINKGYLAVNSNMVVPYVNFNVDGFPTSSPAITQGMYLKGNFIVDGLIFGTDGTSATGFNHKLHIEGKVVSLNSPSEPSQGRRDQVSALLGASYLNQINLENTFLWSCGFNGLGSDGTPCSTGGITSLVPLVILNGNFPGNLLQ